MKNQLTDYENNHELSHGSSNEANLFKPNRKKLLIIFCVTVPLLAVIIAVILGVGFGLKHNKNSPYDFKESKAISYVKVFFNSNTKSIDPQLAPEQRNITVNNKYSISSDPQQRTPNSDDLKKFSNFLFQDYYPDNQTFSYSPYSSSSSLNFFNKSQPKKKQLKTDFGTRDKRYFVANYKEDFAKDPIKVLNGKSLGTKDGGNAWILTIQLHVLTCLVFFGNDSGWYDGYWNHHLFVKTQLLVYNRPVYDQEGKLLSVCIYAWSSDQQKSVSDIKWNYATI